MPDTLNTNERSVSSSSQGYLFGYILIAIVILAALIFFFKTFSSERRTSDAAILKNELYLNENLVYNDNTRGAKNWLWEFGDGARSAEQNGAYRYGKAGSYIIRLTIDGALRVQFPVTVKDTVVEKRVDTALTINGPTSGVVNEEVRLEAEGKGTQFEWSFGETGRVDVNGRTALYTFRSPGKFLVRLTSDRGPATHIMYITDPSQDTVLVIPGEGERKRVDDIRAHLQAIANGADFNSNFYYLTHKYLCDNEKVTVAIDQDSVRRSSDFYTYCIGLTFGGEISVDQAQLTISANASCATLLNIKQHSAKTVKL